MATIERWQLLKEDDFSKKTTIERRRLFEEDNYSKKATDENLDFKISST